jgi:tetratricopeptide (TPR) repeat protein
MKIPGLPIISLVLFCLTITSVNAAPGAVISSAAADTQGPPPQDVSSFISQSKVAVTEQNWTGTLLITTRGLAWYPDDPGLLCLQSYTLRKMGQYGKSVDVASKAIALDPKPILYANRGYGYLALGNYSAALADAEAGISADAGYTTNYGVKALALEGMGRNNDALAAIETGITRSPDTAHYWHIKGRILAAGGNCTAAAAALEKSMAIDPGYTLPYPLFGNAGMNLADLNTTCRPAPPSPLPTRSSSGWIAVTGCLCAVIAAGIKR